MIAITRLITHAIVGATGTEAAVEFFIFEKEFRGMDEGRIHLIIYIRAGEDVIDTLPLAFVTVGAFDTVFAMGISREIMQPMTVYLLEDITVRSIVEVACDDEVGIWRDGMDGVDGLAKASCGCLPEGPTIAFAAITARQMHYKNMKCVARDGLAADIENITRRTHAFYRRDTKRITADGSERERAVEQGNINTSKIWR